MKDFDPLKMIAQANPSVDLSQFLEVLKKQPGSEKLVARLEEQERQKKIQQVSNPGTEAWLKKFLTVDPEMIMLKDDIRKLSKSSAPVLITGETGTGKELIAQALHGDRKGHFVDLNCAGLPEHLIESELFGHTKGAFTGAFENKSGLIWKASNGTLFLDEIGELKPALQAKLLRVIQERKVRMVGGECNRDVTCRFVAATHHNLQESVKAGIFREDLYWRLATFEVFTKPLWERCNDIDIILQDLCPGYPKLSWSRDLLKGNVRSLQVWVERYKVLGKIPPGTDPATLAT